jgi:hypothetical protein
MYMGLVKVRNVVFSQEGKKQTVKMTGTRVLRRISAAKERR